MPCKGIHAISSGPVEFPDLVYSFVICDEKTVMIDTGVSNSVMDISFLDKLDYLVLTHVHVDHVGGVSELVQRYKPKIILYQGFSKYLKDTRNLNTSARKVLGDLLDIYGEVDPVNGGEFLEVKGGEELKLGKYIMKIFYTPGHAKHHISIFIDDILYSGDSAGGRYNGIPFPTTPPPLDYSKYIESLKFQISLNPRMVGLSHGGFVSSSHLKEHLDQIISSNYRVDIDLGGTAGEVLNKLLEINYTGLTKTQNTK